MYLFINAAQKGRIELQLLDDNKSVATLIKEGDYKISEKLLFFVNRLLEDRNLAVKDVKGILTVSGPGAFTSIRVSAVVVNTLNQISGIPTYSDLLDKLDTEEKRLKALKKLSHKHSVIPYYDREANITVPKE